MRESAGNPMAAQEEPIWLLIVDDSESNRLTLQLLLEDAGYRVETASCIQEAQQQLFASGRTYQLAFLDQHLGQGLGSELASLIRQVSPQTRLILMSASFDFADAIIPTDSVDATLDKDSDFTQVLALLGKLLKGESDNDSK